MKYYKHVIGGIYIYINKDPTYFRESQLQRRLLNLKKKVFFSLEVYDKVYPRGSKPTRVYGLPKTHKTFEITHLSGPLLRIWGHLITTLHRS